jgi:hypothetical protein
MYGIRDRHVSIDLQTYYRSRRVHKNIIPQVCEDKIQQAIDVKDLVFRMQSKEIQLTENFRLFYEEHAEKLKKDAIKELLIADFVLIGFKYEPIMDVSNNRSKMMLVPYVLNGRLGIDYNVIVYNDPKNVGSHSYMFVRLVDSNGKQINPTPDPNVLIFAGKNPPDCYGQLQSPASKIINDYSDINRINNMRMTAQHHRSNPPIYTETTENSDGVIRDADKYIYLQDVSEIDRDKSASVAKNDFEMQLVYDQQRKAIEMQNINMSKNVLTENQIDMVEQNRTRLLSTQFYPLPINHTIGRQVIPESYNFWESDNYMMENHVCMAYGVPRQFLMSESKKSSSESAVSVFEKLFSSTVQYYKNLLSMIYTRLYSIMYGDLDEAQIILFNYINKHMGLDSPYVDGFGVRISDNYININDVNKIIRHVLELKQRINGINSPDNMVINKLNASSMFAIGYELIKTTSNLKPKKNISLFSNERSIMSNSGSNENRNKNDINDDEIRALSKNLDKITSAPILQRYLKNDENLSQSTQIVNNQSTLVNGQATINDDDESLKNNMKSIKDKIELIYNIANINSIDGLNIFKNTQNNSDFNNVIKIMYEEIHQKKSIITIQFSDTPIVNNDEYIRAWSMGILDFNTMARMTLKNIGINPQNVEIKTKDPWGVQEKLSFFQQSSGQALTKLGVVADVLFPKLGSTYFSNQTDSKPGTSEKKPGTTEKKTSGEDKKVNDKKDTDKEDSDKEDSDKKDSDKKDSDNKKSTANDNDKNNDADKKNTEKEDKNTKSKKRKDNKNKVEKDSKKNKTS